MDGTAVSEIAALADRSARTVEVGGKTYSPVTLTEVKPEKEKDLPLSYVAPPVLVLGTLTGFCDYIKDNPDRVASGEVFGRARVSQFQRPVGAKMIHIKSPTCVELLSAYQDDDANSRMCFVRAEVKPQSFPFGQYMSREDFQIMLQARFAAKGDHGRLLSFVGNVLETQEVGQRDNGVTQTVSARAGIVNADKVEIPNPVNLAPYRSFPEIDPPLSLFIFRLQGGGGKPVTAALFEADAGLWAVDTASAIEMWVKDAIPLSELLVIR